MTRETAIPSFIRDDVSVSIPNPPGREGQIMAVIAIPPSHGEEGYWDAVDKAQRDLHRAPGCMSAIFFPPRGEVVAWIDPEGDDGPAYVASRRRSHGHVSLNGRWQGCDFSVIRDPPLCLLPTFLPY